MTGRKALLPGALALSAISSLTGMLPFIFIWLIVRELFTSGSINLFTYLVFLLIASTIYNPVSEVFNNLAALFYLDIRINRMNEMEALPVQHGKTDFNPESYDIVFDKVRYLRTCTR